MIRAILFAQAADLLTMLLMVKAYGKRTEANPVERALLTEGPLAPALAKYAVVALSIGIAAVAGGRVRKGLQLVVFSIGILGAVTNVATIRTMASERHGL